MITVEMRVSEAKPGMLFVLGYDWFVPQRFTLAAGMPLLALGDCRFLAPGKIIRAPSDLSLWPHELAVTNE